MNVFFFSSSPRDDFLIHSAIDPIDTTKRFL